MDTPELKQRDEHWQAVLKQELQIVRGNIRNKVRSEVCEALFALERDEPNVPLAIRRLKQIERYLHQLKDPV